MDGTQIVTRDKLVADLKLVVNDAEELLKITAGQAGERVAAVRDKVQRGLDQAKVKLVELEDRAVVQTKAAGSTYGIALDPGVLNGFVRVATLMPLQA